jgi:hypothetical protein
MFWNRKQSQVGLMGEYLAVERDSSLLGTDGTEESPTTGKVSFANRWVPRSMLILSFVALVPALAMGAVILDVSHKAPAGLAEGLGNAIALGLLAVVTPIASLVGCVCAVVGLGYLAFVRRRFGRMLAVMLALNAAASAVPYLYSQVHRCNKAAPPVVRTVRSGDIERVQSILRGRESPAQPNMKGYLVLQTAVHDSRIDTIRAIVAAYAKSNRAQVARRWPAGL